MFSRCRAAERLVNATVVVIALELVEFSRQIERVPEQRRIKVITPNRPDQAFYERMGNRV